MPQWSRDRVADQEKYPNERARSLAPRALRPLLRRYDHHVIRVERRPALLLTSHWDAVEEADALARADLLPFEISFTYAAGHPHAPAEVQAIADSLTFTPVAISTERANER